MRQLSRFVLAIGYGGGAVLLLLLLTKGNADALTARMGYTAASVIVFGLVAGAGARLLDRPEPISLWGYATLLIAAATFVLTLVEIWPDDIFPETRTMVMVLISLLLGGGSLVLGGRDDDADQAIRVARSIAVFALVALGALTVLIASGVDISSRWFGVASTLFVVSALSLPFLRFADEDSSVGTAKDPRPAPPASR